MKKLRNLLLLLPIACGLALRPAQAIDHPGLTQPHLADGRFTLLEAGRPDPLLLDPADDSAVQCAAQALRADFGRVSGCEAALLDAPAGPRLIVAGTCDSRWIRQLADAGKIDLSPLAGKREMYLMLTVEHPFDGVGEALVIAGSDRRGAVYGIYELSEQLGVSPWYDWADVPVVQRSDLSIARGCYTAGEPAVRYRGIFLNDEAPCLTSWVYNTYGTRFGDHRFYARVFELLLRLRGNFLWPAMWGWSFYADDPENSRTAREMGIIMGTSHHEPMARNHQEWARKRNEYGPWDYAKNQRTIDRFFREGIERVVGTEDLITIGMRGDGDTPMGGTEGKDHEYQARYDENMRLMQRIFDNQRRIIRQVTGRPAEERPQVWALYKEVQAYYDRGLRPPQDVIMLLSDDNWGDVRRLPDAAERQHPGGWGMYYHVDYVGAPRNSKWLNVTPIQHLWEQMQLTYDYGVDRLWVLNVGDLKPMEYPITLFLNMAWDPKRYDASTLLNHTRAFCAQQFGPEQADEAARILNLACKYAGRITPELLDRHTYNLETGEWRQVTDAYLKLEAEALRQYMTLEAASRDAYFQLILFPVQAMANLYQMYFAQAMNHRCYAANDPEANAWADEVERCFARDAALCRAYNERLAGGKWNGMMTQKHIGYTEWHDNFPADTLPEIFRIEAPAAGGYCFRGEQGYVAIEAEHYYDLQPAPTASWQAIPHVGRTLGGMTLMPYTEPVDGAAIRYRMELPVEPGAEVTLHVVVKSTLAFANRDGHRYAVGFEGAEEQVVNFNGEMNEEPQNIHTRFYPTVARRVIETVVPLRLPGGDEPIRTLVFRPLDPGVVLEKLVVDYGGYQRSYLFMEESPRYRE